MRRHLKMLVANQVLCVLLVRASRLLFPAKRRLSSVRVIEGTSKRDVARCNDEQSDIRENWLRLKGEMDGLRDELFARPEEAVIEADGAHVVTDGSVPSNESDAKKAWKEHAAHLRKVQ